MKYNYEDEFAQAYVIVIGILLVEVIGIILLANNVI